MPISSTFKIFPGLSKRLVSVTIFSIIKNYSSRFQSYPRALSTNTPSAWSTISSGFLRKSTRHTPQFQLRH
jgi:hypothetical protein